MACTKTLTVRLPDGLVARIEAESRRRNPSKSEVVRERLSRPARGRRKTGDMLDAIADVVGSIDGLAPDLSARRKERLKASGYGAKRHR